MHKCEPQLRKWTRSFHHEQFLRKLPTFSLYCNLMLFSQQPFQVFMCFSPMLPCPMLPGWTVNVWNPRSVVLLLEHSASPQNPSALIPIRRPRFPAVVTIYLGSLLFDIEIISPCQVVISVTQLLFNSDYFNQHLSDLSKSWHVTFLASVCLTSHFYSCTYSFLLPLTSNKPESQL